MIRHNKPKNSLPGQSPIQISQFIISQQTAKLNTIQNNILDIRKCKAETQNLVYQLTEKISNQEQIIYQQEQILNKKQQTIRSQENTIHTLGLCIRKKQDENEALRRVLKRQQEKNKQHNQDIAYMVRERIQVEKTYKSRIMELQAQLTYRGIYVNSNKKLQKEQSTMI